MTEGIGFLGKLKSFVVEEVPEAPAPSKPAAAAPAATVVQALHSAQGVADPEVRKLLEKDIQVAA